MHKSNLKKISLAICLAFMPLYGTAAGLGKLNVSSGLGEPLNAEIELLSVTPDELATLVGTIASEEAYLAQGVTRLGIHSNIKVDLVKNASGTPVLKLRTAQPIDDPYLDVLIQLDWASGRLLREYTVLLDPPGYKDTIQEATASVIAPPSTSALSATAPSAPVVTSTQGVAAVSQYEQKLKRSSKKTASSAADTSEDTPQKTASSGEVVTKRGDTLNSIAREMQVDGVSLDQMLVGLFESNKDAFNNGNMNRLKVGQIIKVPSSKETLAAFDAQQAKQLVKLHASNWDQYRNSLSGSVVKAQAVAELEQKQISSGKIVTAEDKASTPKSGNQDIVKLSAGKDLAAKISSLQEEAIAREKALQEAQDRASVLEKQIADMQKLLALKNQSMAELQKNAENKAPADEVKATEAKPVVAKPAEVAVKVEDQAHKPVQPVVKPDAKPVEKVAKVEVAAEPEVEPTFIEGLMANEANFAMLGGAATITLLGAAWMYLRNKRRKDLDSFERGILTSGGLRANTVFGNTTGSSSTSDTSFLTDFAQSVDGNMIDTNDVDPIAEAEVYMAYGREAQAEEILKDAISREPKRHELQLKLLEMYANRKDTAAFETVAGELYASLGSSDPIWAKVAELGATIEPSNPLYDVSKPPVAPVSSEKLTATDFENVPVATNEALDFSLDDDLNIEPASVTQEAFVDTQMNTADSQGLSFDLGEVETPATVADALLLEAESEQQAPSEDNLFANQEESSVLDLLAESPGTEHSPDFNMAELELPQISESETVGEATVATVAENDDALAALDLKLTPVDAKAVALEEPAAEIDFDLPSVQDTAPALQAPEVFLAGIDLDLTQPEPAVQPDVEVKKEFEAKLQPEVRFDELESAGVEEITFDLPLNNEPVSAVAEAAAEKESLRDEGGFDFSSINLDLGDDELAENSQTDSSQLDDALLADTSVSAESENQEVDIKLDLVAAYIDMDDKEGARELLDEVIKEGGPLQRQRAEQLLAGLA